MLLDGTWADLMVGTDAVPPYLVLTLASAAFFTASDAAQQEGEYCTILSRFDPTPSRDDLANVNGADLWWSYEVTVDITAHDCAGVLNANVWGANAEQVVSLYDGTRVGIGFGPMTPYLEQAFTPADLGEYGDSFFGVYIAIDHAPAPWAP